MKRALASLGFALALVASPAIAAGPSPDQRNETLAICPDTSQMCTLSGSTLVCDSSSTTACGVNAAFPATLVLTVNDDPPCDNDSDLACGVANPNTTCSALTSTTGTTTVTISGRKRRKRTFANGGMPFSLSQ